MWIKINEKYNKEYINYFFGYNSQYMAFFNYNFDYNLLFCVSLKEKKHTGYWPGTTNWMSWSKPFYLICG